MTALLIRNIDDVLRVIDALAERMGLSRNEFLCRELAEVAQRTTRQVTGQDLERMAEIADLDDEAVMEWAWR